MAKALEKLSKLITQSSIPLNDQNDLLVFLPVLPEPVMEKLVELFEKQPNLIKEFNENFKAKVNILINGRDNWEKLIAEEEEKLTQMDKEFGDEF